MLKAAIDRWPRLDSSLRANDLQQVASKCCGNGWHHLVPTGILAIIDCILTLPVNWLQLLSIPEAQSQDFKPFAGLILKKRFFSRIERLFSLNLFVQSNQSWKLVGTEITHDRGGIGHMFSCTCQPVGHSLYVVC